MPNLSFEEQLMFWDLINYLPNNILVKVDRASMSTSLETRAPFLDHKLVEYVSKLPPDLKIRKGNSKYLLKQILFKHIPKTYFERPKAGFSVPLDEWLKGPLKNWAEDLLDENKIKQQEVILITKKLRNYGIIIKKERNIVPINFGIF